jgi:hypothetical protein
MASDPLGGLQGQEKILFDLFTGAASGKNLDAVLGAAVNLIINAVRQTYAKRSDAEARFDELFGRAKQILLANHYDSVTGMRRSVFPHTQVVRMPFHLEDDVHSPTVNRNKRG